MTNTVITFNPVRLNPWYRPPTTVSFTCVVYILGSLLGSVGHPVKIHKITSSSGNERGDIEIKNYVVFPCGQDNWWTPCPLIMDFTMILDRFGRSHLNPTGELTHTLHSDGVPHPDDVLKNTVSPKILYCNRLYDDRPDPIVFMTLVVNTSDRLYHDLSSWPCSCTLIVRLDDFITAEWKKTRDRENNVALGLWCTVKPVNLTKWTHIMWHLGRELRK
jgi:hypothetical protein